MSLLKSEAKLTAVNELGNRLDDALENANKDLHKEEGAVTALKNATAALENLIKVASKDLDEKQVDLETQVVIKKYLERARTIVSNMSSVAENSRQAQAGKIAAFRHAVDIAKKYKDEEFKKFHIMRSAIERNIETSSVDSPVEEAENQTRPAGTRPGPSIKLRRLAEEAVKENTQASNTENVENSSPETHNLTEVEVPKTKSKKQKK
jgi:hypothetical protein